MPTPTLLTEFAQAIELPDARLYALQREGDAAERLWASWALALRQGRGASDSLRAALAAEPNAGTRSLVATVLAGLGDAATLRALAATDAAPLVRETACQCLARIAGDDPGVVDFLLHRLAQDRAPQVRAAIVLALPPSTPDAAFERCVALLGDPELTVREAAVRRFVARARTDAALPAELGDGGLAALVGATSAQRAAVLDRCVLRGVKVAWSELAPLADRPVSRATRGRLLALLDPARARPALAWLAHEVCARPDADGAACDLLLAALAAVPSSDELAERELSALVLLAERVTNTRVSVSPAVAALEGELRRLLAARASLALALRRGG